MYSKSDFIHDCQELFSGHPGNTVDIPHIGPTVLFDEPLIGFAAASDELFQTCKNKDVIGRRFLSPSEWMDDAKTVISIFFPITEKVRASNTDIGENHSMEWLYARVEGQDFIDLFIRQIQLLFTSHGINSCVPSLDERFVYVNEEIIPGNDEDYHVDTSWSERHAAYVSGLGTFGLSRGLITSKGVAGRFTSIIIDAAYQPLPRDYSGVYDYCIRCGKCAELCPIGAITLNKGKNNVKCEAMVDEVERIYSHGYGCGKCQLGVPCECNRPEKPEETSGSGR